MKVPELLSPAGSIKHMKYAFTFGADAVYAGQPRYSLRVRNNSFTMENLGLGIEYAHSHGKKFYVASNIMPHNAKVKTYLGDMAPVIAMQPDALIMADPGLILMIRETWPDMPVHLSVQANTVNYAAVRFWASLGLTRIILSRELSFDEIAEIRQLCPDVELEVFVHGALCVAYSGRCLLSGYFNHRDPNQGTCTNACRWQYNLHSGETDDCHDVQKLNVDFMAQMQAPAPQFEEKPQARHPLADATYLIEEANRPGQYMPVMEDEHGTYIMNSKDLRAVHYIHRLVEMGVDCLKIEGRTKSHYYVARTAQVYRQAIDDAVAGRPFNPLLWSQLENLSNRGYTDGFYQRHADQEYQNYLENYSNTGKQRFVGEVLDYDAGSRMAHVAVKNKLCLGDEIEVIRPDGNREFVLEHMLDMHGAPLQEALGSGYEVKIVLPEGDNGMALLAKKEPSAV
ncbi:MAG: tRNA 5-hydroxyuridine modification protein YegQ [Gammaproteobacteria bacterium]|nr:tRNA 5-hydroxyuridine modification protein YegQ [Gammaproteobacteria bacterium]MDH5801210.1 tRNA 5-hydroxyuridine modification protein YegQ [Gammaproteobacteria bacterium]